MLKRIMATLEKIASHSRLLSALYTLPYRKIIKRETDLLMLEEGDRLLFIGAGSVPFTPLLIAKEKNVTIIAVDTDAAAVKRARKVVGKHNLDDRIEILHRDGRDLEGLAFTHALIALQAEPKGGLISAIRAHNEKARIAARTANPRFSRFYEALPDVSINGYKSHRFKAFEATVHLE